jgi:hypothetical protein
MFFQSFDAIFTNNNPSQSSFVPILQLFAKTNKTGFVLPGVYIGPYG